MDIWDLLGCETRRRIIKIVINGPKYKTEIARILDIGQKAINEHLELLKKFGFLSEFVERQDRGRPRIYYTIPDEIKSIIEDMERMIKKLNRTRI